MCFNWENIENRKNRQELSIQEISKIADGFNKLHSLIISGGEPFMRQDVSDIISEFHKRLGIRHVSIPTNLFCNDAPEKIRSIAIKHPGIFFRILISLDDIGEDHDVIRGHKGGFKKLMWNYERLRVYKKNLGNLSLNVATVFTSYNAEKMTHILDFSGGLDIDDIKLIYVRGDTREHEAKDVTPEQYEYCVKYAEKIIIKKNRTKSLYNNVFSSASLVAKELISESLIKKQQVLHCNAGSRFVVISETGEVFPCETLGQKLGNLRQYEYSISSIMKSGKAQKVMRFINDGKCSCTMDCNTISNVIYSPSVYLRVLKKLLAFYKERFIQLDGGRFR